jgi:hypothetical protein
MTRAMPLRLIRYQRVNPCESLPIPLDDKGGLRFWWAGKGGAGRSYSDAALNDDGAVFLMTRLRQLIDFDPGTGVVECEVSTTTTGRSGLLKKEGLKSDPVGIESGLMHIGGRPIS